MLTGCMVGGMTQPIMYAQAKLRLERKIITLQTLLISVTLQIILTSVLFRSTLFMFLKQVLQLC